MIDFRIIFCKNLTDLNQQTQYNYERSGDQRSPQKLEADYKKIQKAQ